MQISTSRLARCLAAASLCGALAQPALAVDNQGSVPTTFGNGFASGASGVSLRGLGTSSTLVLLNGRRVAPRPVAMNCLRCIVLPLLGNYTKRTDTLPRF